MNIRFQVARDFWEVRHWTRYGTSSLHLRPRVRSAQAQYFGFMLHARPGGTAIEPGAVGRVVGTSTPGWTPCGAPEAIASVDTAGRLGLPSRWISPADDGSRLLDHAPARLRFVAPLTECEEETPGGLSQQCADARGAARV
jgi:hypothetical protein